MRRSLFNSQPFAKSAVSKIREKFPARTNKRTIRRANRLDETRALNVAPPRFLPGVRVILFFQLLFFSPAPTTG